MVLSTTNVLNKWRVVCSMQRRSGIDTGCHPPSPPLSPPCPSTPRVQPYSSPRSLASLVKPFVLKISISSMLTIHATSRARTDILTVSPSPPPPLPPSHSLIGTGIVCYRRIVRRIIFVKPNPAGTRMGVALEVTKSGQLGHSSSSLGTGSRPKLAIWLRAHVQFSERHLAYGAS